MKREIEAKRINDIHDDSKKTESQPLILRHDDEDQYASDLFDTTKAKSIWKDTNWKQKSTVLYVSIVNYISFLCYSACSPFLARVMMAKGGTVLLSTIVLQITTLSSCIFAIIFGKYQARIGSKTLILSGQLFFGLFQIVFGTIGYIEDYRLLMVVGTLLRALLGACQAATSVAGLTIVCQEFPDFISTVFGIFEAAYGAGYLSGPYVGGFLYDWSNGTMLPMAVTGLICLLYAFVGFNILKKTENRQSFNSQSHIGTILSNPKAVFTIGIGGTIIGGLGLCDSTITVYLKGVGFTATKVGQLLFIMGLAYCLTALSIGIAIRSRKVLRRTVITLGLLGGFALPFVWVPNQQELWIYVAAFGYGMCAAITFIPTFDELRDIVDTDGESSSDLSLNSALSGIWAASVSMFNFTGPLIGSAMEMSLPYSISFVASLAIAFGTTIFLSLISAFFKCQYAKK